MTPKETIADIQDRFTQVLALPLKSVQPIQVNKYCAIYLGTFDQQRIGHEKCILKRYFGDDSTMAAQEARALDYYSRLVKGREEWMPSRCLAFSEEANLMAIQFIPGMPLSRFIYRMRKGIPGLASVLEIGRELGAMLRQFHDETANEYAEPSDILFDYMRYTSRQLENRSQRKFARYSESAERLIEDYSRCGVAATFCHGDFVMRNMHVDTDQVSGRHRVGLIDFGNSLDYSHVLGDLFGFYFSVMHTYLPMRCRLELIHCVVRGLIGRGQDLQFPEAAVRFHYEYHRRRWVMLKLQSRNLIQRHRMARYVTASMPDLDLVQPFTKRQKPCRYEVPPG